MGFVSDPILFLRLEEFHEGGVGHVAPVDLIPELGLVAAEIDDLEELVYVRQGRIRGKRV